jgi:hypothetical protein
LCCELFSIQDKNFRPCQCGYQVELAVVIPQNSMLSDSFVAPDLHVVLASHQERAEWALSKLSITVSSTMGYYFLCES